MAFEVISLNLDTPLKRLREGGAWAGNDVQDSLFAGGVSSDRALEHAGVTSACRPRVDYYEALVRRVSRSSSAGELLRTRFSPCPVSDGSPSDISRQRPEPSTCELPGGAWTQMTVGGVSIGSTSSDGREASRVSAPAS